MAFPAQNRAGCMPAVGSSLTVPTVVNRCLANQVCQRGVLDNTTQRHIAAAVLLFCCCSRQRSSRRHSTPRHPRLTIKLLLVAGCCLCAAGCEWEQQRATRVWGHCSTPGIVSLGHVFARCVGCALVHHTTTSEAVLGGHSLCQPWLAGLGRGSRGRAERRLDRQQSLSLCWGLEVVKSETLCAWTGLWMVVNGGRVAMHVQEHRGHVLTLLRVLGHR